MQEKRLQLVTQALTSLLDAQPGLLDLVPVMGHTQGFLKNLASNKLEVVKSSLLILRQLSRSPQCITCITSFPQIMEHLMQAMKLDSSIIPDSCEILDKLCQVQSDSLIQRAIDSGMVQFLLKLLDSSSVQSMGTKALIVQVLKVMQCHPIHGPDVNGLLNGSSVWSEFKDQRHDLFITNPQPAGYLRGCKYTKICLVNNYNSNLSYLFFYHYSSI